MASPAEIKMTLPETLPEDFNDWDGEYSGVPQAIPSRGFEAASGLAAVAKPPAQPAKPQGTVSRAADRSRKTPLFTRAEVYTDHEALIQSMRMNSETIEGRKRKNKKTMRVVAVGLILLLLGLIPLFYLKLQPMWAMMRHPAILQPAVVNDLPETNTLKPSPSTQADRDQSPACGARRAASGHGNSAPASSAVKNDERAVECAQADNEQHEDGGGEGSSAAFGVCRGRYARPEW